MVIAVPNRTVRAFACIVCISAQRTLMFIIICMFSGLSSMHLVMVCPRKIFTRRFLSSRCYSPNNCAAFWANCNLLRILSVLAVAHIHIMFSHFHDGVHMGAGALRLCGFGFGGNCGEYRHGQQQNSRQKTCKTFIMIKSSCNKIRFYAQVQRNQGCRWKELTAKQPIGIRSFLPESGAP